MLINLLTTRGEKLSQEELEECMNLLTGSGTEGLPEDIDPVQFAQEILGFGDDAESLTNDEAEQMDGYSPGVSSVLRIGSPSRRQ